MKIITSRLALAAALLTGGVLAACSTSSDQPVAPGAVPSYTTTVQQDSTKLPGGGGGASAESDSTGRGGGIGSGGH